MATASFALPQNATVDKAGSSCSAGVTTQQQLLKLQFASGTVLHNVTVRFSRANETANVNVDEIAFEYDLSDTTKFVNASKTDKPLQRAFSDQEYVSIPKDNYYSCDSAEPAALKNEELNLTVTASFSGVKAEAFRTSNSSDFNGTQFICPFDHTTPMPVTTTPAPVTRATYNLTVANKTCLMAWFQMSLMVKYNTTDKKVAMHTFNSTDTIGTVNAKMSSCDNKTATLFVDGWIDDGWSFALDFAMADNKFSLSHVQVNFTLKDSKTFVNASDDGKPHVSETNFTKWAATVGHSYTCKDSDVWSLNVDEFKNFVPELSITLSNIQVQAFMSADAVKPEFGTAEDCSYTSDIVPIAVGCALALLVVIVLIAYVIGRRRNRARGYESM
jgi:lysosomal-associated membrane protein 1/2